MSYKMPWHLSYNKGFLLCSLALAQVNSVFSEHDSTYLIRNLISYYTMKKNKNNSNSKSPSTRTMRMDCRLTPEEYNTVKKKASNCGMTLSNYLRKCAIGHSPKQHLTDKECEILCAFTDRRSELYHVRNALNGLSQDERMCLFHDMSFMRQWLQGVDNTIEQFDFIIEQLKS